MRDVTPLRVLAVYMAWPAACSMMKSVPPAGVVLPAWTAAVQMDESPV